MKYMMVAVPPEISKDTMPKDMNTSAWYALGAVIAILLLIYLVISLVKPDKF